MKSKTLLQIGLLGFLCLVGAGCATAPNQPQWAGKIWTDKQYLYVSGISSGCTDTACAKNSAYADALQAAAEYAGVSIQSQTNLQTTNDQQLLTASYQARTEELQIRNLEIEDFKINRTLPSMTGFIILKIEQKELERAKRLQKEILLQEQKQNKRKQQLGPFYVPPVKGWPELTAAVESLLRAQQYIVGTKGQPVVVKVSLFQCNISLVSQVYVCSLQASLSCHGKKQTFLSKGYGLTLQKAKQEAVHAWVSQLPQNVAE